MFRKIVSHLPFSPSLINELGFYAKRLGKEEATRRLGLIFTALALIVQSFVIFSPPESANAADPSDMVYGGVWSSHQLMSAYDGNHNDIKNLFDTIGITRDELARASHNTQRLDSSSNYSWGMTSNFSAAQGEGSYSVKSSRGGMRHFYYRPHRLWGNFTYSAFVGHSAKFGWFAIMKNCGNLITRHIPPAPTCPPGQIGNYPNCTTPPKKCPIPGKEHLNVDDPGCKKDPVVFCNHLVINRNGNSYQLTGTGTTFHGASINEYVFTIYHNGKQVKRLTSKAPTVTYIAKEPGEYKVDHILKTSIGDRSASGCTKTFTVTPPEKCPLNPSLLKSDPRCQPCPGDATRWIEDKTCAASFLQIKSALNMTQGNIDATTKTAKASDRIVYRLKVSNKGLAPEQYTFRENLGDVLQYATLFDAGGGELKIDNNRNSSAGDKKTILEWPVVTLKPGETQERSFTVRMADTISPMSTGTSHPGSFDCRMDNTFGNTVSVAVDCPAEKKVVETVASQLPKTGAGDNLLFAGALLAVVTYFYTRSRQLKKEVRLVRQNFNAGTM